MVPASLDRSGKVAVLDGGYQAWVNHKFPVATKSTVPEAGVINANEPLEIPTEMKTVQRQFKYSQISCRGRTFEFPLPRYRRNY